MNKEGRMILIVFVLYLSVDVPIFLSSHRIPVYLCRQVVAEGDLACNFFYFIIKSKQRKLYQTF